MNSDARALVVALLREQRQAALGSLRDDGPFVSMVAFVAEPDFSGVLLLLSQLAAHTRQLLADPRAALLICEPDDGRDDVQTLARLSLVGQAAPLPESDIATARERYLARLPAAQMLFTLPDFRLFRFVPSEARLIGGFARAWTLTPEQLRSAATSS